MLQNTQLCKHIDIWTQSCRHTHANSQMCTHIHVHTQACTHICIHKHPLLFYVFFRSNIKRLLLVYTASRQNVAEFKEDSLKILHIWKVVTLLCSQRSTHSICQNEFVDCATKVNIIIFFLIRVLRWLSFNFLS